MNEKVPPINLWNVNMFLSLCLSAGDTSLYGIIKELEEDRRNERTDSVYSK